MIYMMFHILLVSALVNIIVTNQSMIENQSVSKILSRRKRFLIFPEGSSFQLVICTQNHGYLHIGDIVWFGTTAALAWELPTDPGVFDMFRDKHKLYEANRKNDVIYYLNDEGKVIDVKEHKRKIIINPAFAKRSTDSMRGKNKIDSNYVKKLHLNQKNKNYWYEFDATEIAFHRNGRQELYAKLEKFLQALGWNYRDCVLHLLCQTGKLEAAQGTFLDEIFRAVFTLPKVHVESKVHNQYDDAHGANGDCAHLYPNCEHSPIM
ncbi:unnamed protein product [Arctia plantaginis]|nr:unnamed protein product [Arctia plantaginis]